jgi:cytidine deaminase
VSNLDPETWARLVEAAKSASRNAHAPYSSFHVGAALLTVDGEIAVGCNVENATFGATVCAERNAISNAVVAGWRNFRALVVITPATTPVAPCGLCRQVLAEFCEDLDIMMVNEAGEELHLSLAELLPHPFTSKDL